MRGLWDHRTFSLGHQRHFLWHDASWFTISPSSFPWLRRSLSGSPRASIWVEQEFAFQKLRSGHLLNGDWQKSHIACFIMWALFAFHTKWAETLKLISDSSQNQMATLSLGSRSAHYRQSCPTPEFARNVLVSKPLRPLFSAERNFIPQLHGCLHPQKKVFTSAFAIFLWGHPVVESKSHFGMSFQMRNEGSKRRGPSLPVFRKWRHGACLSYGDKTAECSCCLQPSKVWWGFPLLISSKGQWQSPQLTTPCEGVKVNKHW